MPQSPDAKELNANKVKAKQAQTPAPANAVRGFGGLPPPTGLIKRIEAVKARRVSPPTTGPRDYAPQYLPPKSGPSTPVGWQETPPTPIEEVPNYDKLSGFEKWVTGWLPGVGNAGEAMARWDKENLAGVGGLLTNWAGKLLSYADVLAEGAERTWGLGAQALEASSDDARWNDFSSNLKSAWYAGSLMSDVATSTVKPPGYKNIEVDDDLPGLAGMVKARQQIAQLTAQGVEPGEALIQVRDQMYEDAGALAIRMSLHDLYFHIVADPLNIILPLLTPIEAAQAARKGIFAFKILDTTQAVASVDKARDALNVAEAAQDAARIAEAATNLKAAEEALNVANLSKMTKNERFIVWLTGGDPGAKPGKLSRWNPFALTPQARAVEYADLITENIAQHIVPNAIDATTGKVDLNKIARSVNRVVAGSNAPELGHMITTIEGQHVKSVLSEINTRVNALVDAYNATSDFERPLIELVAAATKSTPENVLRRVLAGEQAALHAQFIEGLDGLVQRGLPDVVQRLAEILARRGLQAGQLTPDALGGFIRVFQGNHAFNSQVIMGQILAAVQDTAMKQAVTRFGVQQRGWFTALMDGLKGLESVVFLGGNPKYPVAQVINNDVTMIARGNLGLFTSSKDIERYWTAFGGMPARLAEGMGPAEIAAKVVGKGEESMLEALSIGKIAPEAYGRIAGRKVLAAATRNEIGWLEGMVDAIKGMRLPLDMREFAATIESTASRQAYTYAHQQGWQMFWRPGKGITLLADYSPEAYQAVGRGLADQIQNAVRGVRNSAELEAAVYSDDIALNWGNIQRAAESELGVPLDNILSSHFTMSIQDDLNAVLKTRDAVKVNGFFDGLKGRIREFVQTKVDDELVALAEDAAMRVNTEQSGAFFKLWGDSADEWYAAHERHAKDIAELAESIRRGEDKAIRNARWRKLFSDSEFYWDNQWKRFETRTNAMAQAARKNGLPADAVMDSVKGWRKDWKAFFDKRTKLLDEFHAAELAGQTPPKTWADIVEELENGYKAMSKKEAAYTAAVDNHVAGMIPAEQAGRKELFLAWRNRVARFREYDRELVSAFRKQVRDIPFEQVQEAWAAHWKERLQAWKRMWQEERTGLAALSGNREAAATYQEAIAKAKELSGTKGTAVEATLNDMGFGDLKDAVKAYEANPADPRFAVEAAQPAAKAGETVIADTVFTPRVGQRIRSASGNTEGVIVEVLPSGKLKLKLDDGQTVIRQGKNWTVVSEAQGGEAVVSKAETIALVKEFADQKAKIFRNAPALPDMDAVVPRQMYAGIGHDQLWYMRGSEAVDIVRREAVRAIDAPPVRFGNLPEDTQAALRRYVEHLKGQMGDARYASARFGEYGRDASLLNYNRRMNYNAFLGNLMPFEFWATQSIFKWALHSVDRPAALTTYLRMKKFLETAYRPEQGLPTRLRGSIRIQFPFGMPDFMGDEVFVDPLDTALPFQRFAQMFEDVGRQIAGDEAATRRSLRELLNDGQISQSDYDAALAAKSGAVWDRAVILARQDDTLERRSWVDFAGALTQPHAPLLWAYDRLRGQETGAILPLTHTLGALLGAFGLDPAGPLNPEAAIRKSLGFHPFDRWDDYRIDRMLANMVAEGKISATDARRAMIERKGEAYQTAYMRSLGVEKTGGPAGFTLEMLGLPVFGYPEGEERLRGLANDYASAWDEYNNPASPNAGDYKATVGAFLDKYPEYEARLALYDKPEERLTQFVEDEIWNTWNQMPQLHKNEVHEQLGPLFENAFLNKDTRSPESIPIETMAVWLRLMGGDPPGTLGAVSDMPPLELAPPEIAARAQLYYDTKEAMFPDIQEKLDTYFAIDPAASVPTAPPKWVNDFKTEREQRFPGIDAMMAEYDNIVSSKDRTRYRRDHPQMGEYNDWVSWNRRQHDGFSRYFDSDEKFKGSAMDSRQAYTREEPSIPQFFDWRMNWLLANPDVMPYLVDDPEKRPKYESAAAYEQAVANQPGFSFQEWRQVLGWPLMNLVADYQRGVPLPPVAREQLEKLAAQYGFTGSADEFAAMIAGSNR